MSELSVATSEITRLSSLLADLSDDLSVSREDCSSLSQELTQAKMEIERASRMGGSNLHMVYNRLSSDRVVLMVDFVRPIELWDESTTWSWANGLLRRALLYLHRHVLRMAVPKDAMIFENQNRRCSASPGCFGGT